MIEIVNVTKKFGRVVAVSDLSLKVEAGEFFGFLGPNGAGKTTTIKLLTGLLKPTSGRIFIGGIDITKEPEKAKQKIGYIPDNPYIYDKLSGREFLKFVGGLYGMSDREIDRRIDWLFDLFQVGSWGDERSESYSHGMKQKIVMASAFLHSPEVIIIDEPMVGLDPQSSRLVKDMLKLASRMGTTVFLSTHTLSIAEELCDRIGIVNQGKLVALGTLEELRRQAEERGVENVSGNSLEDLFLSLTGGQLQAKFIDGWVSGKR